MKNKFPDSHNNSSPRNTDACTDFKMKHFWMLIFGTFHFSCLAHANKASLVFEKEPEHVIAVTGKNISLSCRASATGKEITYFWKFNGSFLNEDNTYGFKMSNGLLQINNVNGAEHRGAYECIAFTKDLGSIKSRKANLKIAYFWSDENYTRVSARRVSTFDAVLLQAPTFRALPAATFTWKYKMLQGKGVDSIYAADDKNLFVTSQGHLLMLSASDKYTRGVELSLHHPLLSNRNRELDAEAFLLVNGKEECRDKTMISFPTVQNKKVHEGSNVSFDCLAVAKSCNRETLINWTKIGSHRQSLNQTSRRMVMNNVTKKDHEGTYQCQAQLNGTGDTINITYVLNVTASSDPTIDAGIVAFPFSNNGRFAIKDRPKLFKAVSPNVNLSADGILYPAIFNNTESFSWYKDGEIISNKSALFEVFANGNLRIKDPSPAFSGIYQMFYQNQAGTAVVSQEVRIGSEDGCGWKISNVSGIFSYERTPNLQSDLKCTWFFQVPTTDYIQFNITTFNVPIAQRRKAILSFYGGSSASGAPVEKYHFNTATPSSIAIVKGPFITMLFLGMTSSVGGFTLRYGPSPWAPKMTTTTIAPTTTRKSTKSDPSSKNVMTSKSTFSKHGTTAATTKLSTPQSIPTKEPQKKGGSVIGGIIGGIIGALLLILILLIIYRKKVSKKRGLRRLQKQKSIQNNSDRQRPPYTDVALKMPSHVRPGDSFVDENPCYEPSYGITSDNQIPSYVAPKTRSHVGPGVSLADENPLYEPTGSYGTAKVDESAIYEVVNEDRRYPKATGKNVSPPAHRPPPPTQAAARQFSRQPKPEPVYAQVGEGYKPAYESAKGFTGIAGLTSSPKREKSPAPYDSVPLTAMKDRSRPYGNDPDECLYAEPFDSIRKR